MEFTATAADGYPVHGWVYLPEGEGPHPVLLNIHGGPYAQFGWGWFDEAQAYAAAGYAVVQCNPRGSASYGREHGLAIRHAMGTVDMTDVLAFLDGTVAEFTIDPQAQRRGHGSRLLNACVDTLRADGFERATWWVRSTDDVVRRFLVEAGWAADGSHQEVGTDHGTRLKLIRLHTDIRASGSP